MPLKDSSRTEPVRSREDNITHGKYNSIIFQMHFLLCFILLYIVKYLNNKHNLPKISCSKSARKRWDCYVLSSHKPPPFFLTDWLHLKKVDDGTCPYQPTAKCSKRHQQVCHISAVPFSPMHIRFLSDPVVPLIWQDGLFPRISNMPSLQVCQPVFVTSKSILFVCDQWRIQN